MVFTRRSFFFLNFLRFFPFLFCLFFYDPHGPQCLRYINICTPQRPRCATDYFDRRDPQTRTMRQPTDEPCLECSRCQEFQRAHPEAPLSPDATVHPETPKISPRPPPKKTKTKKRNAKRLDPAQYQFGRRTKPRKQQQVCYLIVFFLFASLFRLPRPYRRPSRPVKTDKLPNKTQTDDIPEESHPRNSVLSHPTNRLFFVSARRKNGANGTTKRVKHTVELQRAKKKNGPKKKKTIPISRLSLLAKVPLLHRRPTPTQCGRSEPGRNASSCSDAHATAKKKNERGRHTKEGKEGGKTNRKTEEAI